MAVGVGVPVVVWPLPKDHVQEVGLFVDWSWNLTVSGAQPEVTLDVNAATGACALTKVPSRQKKLARINSFLFN